MISAKDTKQPFRVSRVHRPATPKRLGVILRPFLTPNRQIQMFGVISRPFLTPSGRIFGVPSHQPGQTGQKTDGLQRHCSRRCQTMDLREQKRGKTRPKVSGNVPSGAPCGQIVDIRQYKQTDILRPSVYLFSIFLIIFAG